MPEERVYPLIVNVTDLEDKWSITSHTNCCDCGTDLEDNDGCPIRLWRNPGSSNCTELALCRACAKKRMNI